MEPDPQTNGSMTYAGPLQISALLESKEQESGMARAHIIICETIQSHHRLAFVYQGLARVVEPYCHGISTTGFEVLRAIQIAGESRSGRLKASSGKLWLVGKMQEVRSTGQEFVPSDPHYNPDDTAMRLIHCRVQVVRR